MVLDGKRLRVKSDEKACDAASEYHAADVISEATSSGTAWTFSAIASMDGGSGFIWKAKVISETTALTARLVLYLFIDTPTCELDDHASNTAEVWADRANSVGKIEFPPLSENGTGASEATASPATSDSIPLTFKCASGVDDLIGVLVAIDAFTQVAGKSIRIELTAEPF